MHSYFHTNAFVFSESITHQREIFWKLRAAQLFTKNLSLIAHNPIFLLIELTGCKCSKSIQKKIVCFSFLEGAVRMVEPFRGHLDKHEVEQSKKISDCELLFAVDLQGAEKK